MKRLGIILALVIVVSLILPATTFAAGTPKVQVPANVEIGKKATLPVAGQSWIFNPMAPRPPALGPKDHATTGILGAPVTGNKYAIAIGITDYPGTDLDLHYAAYDANTVRDTLENVYGFPSANVTVLTDSAASRDAVLAAIADLKAKVSANDEVVFFYSGHGAKLTPTNGPISEGMVLWGGEEPQPYVQFIWDKDLKQAFGGFAANRIIFAFDMCWAGGMNQLAGPGRIVLGAVGQNGIAAEVGSYEAEEYGFPELAQINHGLFTYFFFELGMEDGLAGFVDYDGNPATTQVTVEEAYDFARASLYGASVYYKSLGFPLWEVPVIYDQFPHDMLP